MAQRLIALVTVSLAAIANSAQAEERVPVLIVQRNEMGPDYRLVRSRILLDGRVLVEREGALAPSAQTRVFEATVEPGEHILSAELTYRGFGGGLFRYLEGYGFRATSQLRFTAVPYLPLRLEVVGHERGGPTTPWQYRPAVAFRMLPGRVSK